MCKEIISMQHHVSIKTQAQNVVSRDLHNFVIYLFPLLVSPGVLESASLPSLFCLFNWRCLIKIFVESVFITCPSKITQRLTSQIKNLNWNKHNMFIVGIVMLCMNIICINVWISFALTAVVTWRKPFI